MDRNKDKWTERQINRQKDRKMDRKINKWIERQLNVYKDR